METKTKPHKITSLAAPTKQDRAVLVAMPEKKRRALIEAEIEKGFKGPFRTVTKEEIRTRVLKRLAHD